MGVVTEQRLKNDLKSNRLERAYFLYGEEDYLTRMYTDRIVNIAVPQQARDMNFMRFTEPPRSDELTDCTDSLPFFSDYKCILIKDLDADSMDNAEVKAYTGIIESLPDTTVLIFSQVNVEIEPKKIKARMKKIMDACAKVGCVCEMNYMTAAQISAMAEKKAARAGCTLSRENGAYLAELCARSLTAVSNETEKLCAYKSGGEITKADIDGLCADLTEAGIYTLASELFAGRTARAFKILDSLFAQREEPIAIFAALSGHFTDLYRAKLGTAAGKSAADAAAAFRYPPNRTFVLRNAYRTVPKLSEEYLEGCLGVLYDTNVKLNSSRADKRTLIEQALTEISSLR